MCGNKRRIDFFLFGQRRKGGSIYDVNDPEMREIEEALKQYLRQFYCSCSETAFLRFGNKGDKRPSRCFSCSKEGDEDLGMQLYLQQLENLISREGGEEQHEKKNLTLM